VSAGGLSCDAVTVRVSRAVSVVHGGGDGVAGDSAGEAERGAVRCVLARMLRLHRDGFRLELGGLGDGVPGVACRASACAGASIVAGRFGE
jgi:hypothetical protein